ncbi:MAG: CRISPR-associated endonuclease Cas1, partial [Nitrosarchaeum sp.]
MIIEISTHGSTLKRNHDSFVIQNKEEKSEIPAEKVDAIIISSNSLISTQAVRLCIEKQIQLVISTWSGKPIARMWSSSPGKSTELRRNQYLNQDTVIGYEISLNILTKKLRGQKQFLVDLKNNRKLPPTKLE